MLSSLDLTYFEYLDILVAVENLKVSGRLAEVSVVANVIDFHNSGKTEYHMPLEHYNEDIEIVAASQPLSYYNPNDCHCNYTIVPSMKQ